MTGPPTGARFWLCAGETDMRQGFTGLKARGLAAALGVFVAAASPALMGALFGFGVGLEAMTTGAALLAAAAGMTAIPLLRSDAAPSSDARRSAAEQHVAAEPARSA